MMTHVKWVEYAVSGLPSAVRCTHGPAGIGYSLFIVATPALEFGRTVYYVDGPFLTMIVSHSTCTGP